MTVISIGKKKVMLNQHLMSHIEKVSAVSSATGRKSPIPVIGVVQPPFERGVRPLVQQQVLLRPVLLVREGLPASRAGEHQGGKPDRPEEKTDVIKQRKRLKR